MRDILVVDDFSHVIFQNAFKQYFEELGIKVNDWEGLFEEITKEGGNKAYIRINEDETIVDDKKEKQNKYVNNKTYIGFNDEMFYC